MIEFEDVADEKPSLFSRVSALFSNKQKSEDARFSDVHRAVELVATEQQAFSQRIETALSEQASSLQAQLSAEAAAREQLQADFSQLQAQLSREDGRQDFRPRTSGNGNSNSQDVRTDC